MKDCVFCKIANKEIPAQIIYEDDNFIGILDIAPLNRGHVQLIPRKHFRWTWDVPNFGDYWEAARKVAKLQMERLNAKMVEFLTHGMDVKHAHIWIVPIYGNEAFIKSDNRMSPTNEELDQVGKQMRSKT